MTRCAARYMTTTPNRQPESSHFLFLNPIFSLLGSLIKGTSTSHTSVNPSSFLLASIFLRHVSDMAKMHTVGDTEYPTWVDGRKYVMEDCVEGIKMAASMMSQYSNKKELRGVVTDELFASLPSTRTSLPPLLPSSITVDLTSIQVILGLYRDDPSLKPDEAKLFHLVSGDNRLYIPKKAYGTEDGGMNVFKMPEEYEGNYLKSTVRMEAVWVGRTGEEEKEGSSSMEGKVEGEPEGDEVYGKIAMEGTVQFREKEIEWKVVDEVDIETEEWRVMGGYYE
eukprot:CAMPEP_0118644930 /NCGR_PEP_ID=MMETSP0785-20121206/7221_1 /TAXON_ID=91992 /ORGANISM="Bolidomonas pacifica, Strain CCMP 1866" /LENGTH=279 /DNA_ID=CAMNT_0006536761 /DNA_START=165 /DNA_END=1005 /DNA_ORIENTATION=+